LLSQPALSSQTRRSYRLTLAGLTAALDAAGAEPSAAAIEAAARLHWGTVAPATGNRHAVTVRSFLRYAARQSPGRTGRRRSSAQSSRTGRRHATLWSSVPQTRAHLGFGDDSGAGGGLEGDLTAVRCRLSAAGALMPDNVEPEYPPLLAAGIACTRLIADPAGWINRRVETIELLSHEETRRRSRSTSASPINSSPS